MCTDGRSRRDFLRLLGHGSAAAAAGLILPAGFDDLFDQNIAEAAADTHRITRFEQRRLLDTRSGLTAPNRRIGPSIIEIDTGTDADAVAVTLTCVATRQMHAVVYPANIERPDASLVNIPAGGVRANTTIVSTGGTGRIRVFHHDPAAAVIVDLVAVLHRSTGASGGRIVPVTPTRIVDTRRNSTPFRRDETRLIGRPRFVPADSTAMIVNVTAVNTSGPGHLTLFPADQGTRPNVSNLNIDRTGTVRAGFAIVPITGTGFNAYSSHMGCDLIVDVVGYVTGPNASASSDGLFVPTAPQRRFDSRGSDGAGFRHPTGTTREVGGVAGAAGLFNVTSVVPVGPGHFTAFAAGTPKPTASCLNFAAGDVIANTALVPASNRGIAVYQHGTAHKIIDQFGWITGTPVTATLPAEDGLGLSERYGIQQDYLETLSNEWVDLGTSTDGRLVRAFRIGTGAKVAAIVTHIHGDEWSGESIVVELARQGGVPGWTIWVVPAASPDARARNTRYVNGVDLNRDFGVGWRHAPTVRHSGCVVTQTGPAPYTSREARLLRDAFVSGPLASASVMISHHDNYNWIAPQSGSPYPARQWANDYAVTAGLRLPGQGGTWPSSTSFTRVGGGFETYVASLGQQVFLVENKAGWVSNCTTNSFGRQPNADAVLPHVAATRNLLSHY